MQSRQMQKSDNFIAYKVDAALEEMHEDGTLTELAVKWFGYDISVKD